MGQIKQADVPLVRTNRSVFDRSHSYKTTFDAGYIFPFLVDDILPGDTFSVDASLFARLQPCIVPVMDNLVLDVFYFFVPYRLVWSNWIKMMGERVNPGDSIDFSVPVLTPSGVGHALGSLADYFGLPRTAQCTGALDNISALPFRAYQMIWNEWFRDENLQDRAVVDIGDGPDGEGVVGAVKYRGKPHDYFTSCLPWPQKPGVTGDVSQVQVVPDANPSNPVFSFPGSGNGVSDLRTTNLANTVTLDENATAASALNWADPNLAITISALRQAILIQEFLERDARGGTRYIEILRSQFGVTSPDFRLQRPEFLGGGSVPVTINPVAQTGPATAPGNTPVGSLGAYGVAGGTGIGFTKSFTEHGVLLGLCSVRADLAYQQGIERMWTRRTRYDFYWPALANLPEQAVLRKEIYATGDPANDDVVFGYQERWAEYRYKPSRVTGQLNSTDATALDYWHLAEEFTGAPQLNDTFIKCLFNIPLDRIVAVPGNHHFQFDAFVKMKCVRPMPTHSVPGLGGRL